MLGGNLGSLLYGDVSVMLWRQIEIINFYHFNSDPRFPPFLLYVRWKSGVTFVQRCFRDGIKPEPRITMPKNTMNYFLKCMVALCLG